MLGQYHTPVHLGAPDHAPAANDKSRYRLKSAAEKRAEDLAWQISYADLQLHKAQKIDVEAYQSLLLMKARARKELARLAA